MGNQRTMLNSGFIARCFVLGTILCCGVSVYAASWIGGTGSWNVGSNWNTGVPVLGELVAISQNNAIVNVDSAGNVGGNVRQGENGSTHTVNINYGGVGTALTLNNTWEVGRRNGSTSIVNHDAGSVQVSSISIASGQDATSSYALNGGSLQVDFNMSMGSPGNVAHVGVGSLTLAGGSLSVGRHFGIGSTGGAGSSGTLTLSGGSFNTTAGGGWTTSIGGHGTMSIEGSSVTINHANQFAIASTGTMRFVLDAGGASVFNINNNVFLDGVLQLNMSNRLSTPGDILLLDKASAGAISGVFGSVVTPFGTFSGNEGSTILMGSGGARYTYELTYLGGNGNDLVLQLNDFGYIPEPGTTALFLLGGLILAWRKTRRF